jgi:hypothetical protein
MPIEIKVLLLYGLCLLIHNYIKPKKRGFDDSIR